MDQRFPVVSAGRIASRVLIFIAAVFGFVLLTLTFGGSSASADDGGPDESGLIPAAARIAGGAVSSTAAEAAELAGALAGSAPAATITAPVTGRVDAAVETAIGHDLATQDVVAPVAGLVDSAVKVIGDAVAPVLGVVTGVTTAEASAALDAATASGLTARSDVLAGIAHGIVPGTPGPSGTGQPETSVVSATTTMLPVAALGAAFIVLLFSQRLDRSSPAMPPSPDFGTDTSPD